MLPEGGNKQFLFEAFSFEILQMFLLSRSVKNITASWTALEEEEDDEEEVVEDEESTDIDSGGEEPGDVFELF